MYILLRRVFLLPGDHCLACTRRRLCVHTACRQGMFVRDLHTAAAMTVRFRWADMNMW